MEKLLKFLLKETLSITDFKIQLSEDNSIKTYELIVPAESMGLVIGKKGRTIKMLRNLLKVRAILDKEKFNLMVTSKA
jgi:predicted RNA-binding protein YlqC (UPF0109 family)